jgi:hypothetical protein
MLVQKAFNERVRHPPTSPRDEAEFRHFLADAYHIDVLQDAEDAARTKHGECTQQMILEVAEHRWSDERGRVEDAADPSRAVRVPESHLAREVAE